MSCSCRTPTWEGGKNKKKRNISRHLLLDGAARVRYITVCVQQLQPILNTVVGLLRLGFLKRTYKVHVLIGHITRDTCNYNII